MAKDTDTCTRCHLQYPDMGYVSDMFADGRYLHVCGICALEVTNALHGTKLTRFHGEMAEQMRQDCLAYRKKARRLERAK